MSLTQYKKIKQNKKQNKNKKQTNKQTNKQTKTKTGMKREGQGVMVPLLHVNLLGGQFLIFLPKKTEK